MHHVPLKIQDEVGIFPFHAPNVFAIVAARVMLIVGFCFATVSGYLVGVIGSSNNPTSGLTLSTVIIAPLLMVALGVSGMGGVIAVLGVAARATPFQPRSRRVQRLIAEADPARIDIALVMLRGVPPTLKSCSSSPATALETHTTQRIVGGDMTWPLIIAGMLMGLALVMIGVKSPMPVVIGMYLPVGMTCAIFLGGMVRWVTDTIATRRGLNEAQRMRVESVAVLAAQGLIAGEALTGLVTATLSFLKIKVPVVSESPSYIAGIAVLMLLGLVLVRCRPEK